MVIKDIDSSNPEIKATEESIEITEQNKYYLDSIAKISLLVMLCAGVCLCLAVLFFMLIPIRSPSTVYFQSTPAGQLIQDIPLDKPNMKVNVLFNWVAENMMAIHTFNFVNYASVIENGHEYFTNDGYESYLAALRENNIVEQVLNNKFVMRAVPSNAPQITKEGVLANFYLWKIKLPMTFHYRNVDTDRFEDVDITLLIVRVPTTESPFGIRILKYDLAVKKL